jgi:hypothetical protein
LDEAVDWGAFRLFPEGSAYPERDNPGGPAPANQETTSDIATARDAPILIDPPSGYTRETATVTTFDSAAQSVSQTWKDERGRQLLVRAGFLRENELPIDVTISSPGALVDVRAIMVDSRFAILTQPASGPAPNVGGISVGMDTWIFHLTSPDLGQDELRKVALLIVEGTK